MNLPSGSSTAMNPFGPSTDRKELGLPIHNRPLVIPPIQKIRCRAVFQRTRRLAVVRLKTGSGVDGVLTHLKTKLESSCATKMFSPAEEMEVNG